MEELCELRSAIKAELSNSLAQFDAPQLQLYTNSNRDQIITDLDDITPENTPQYYQKLTQGGSCIVIGTSPPPPCYQNYSLPPSIGKRSLNFSDVENLGQKLKQVAEIIFYIPQESVELLWNAVEEAELVQILSAVSLDEYDGLLEVSPVKNRQKRLRTERPPNHGKRWTSELLTELDTKLREPEITVSEIASIFGRSMKSIELKGAALVDQKVKNGFCLERTLLIYHGKISQDTYNRYQELLKE